MFDFKNLPPPVISQEVIKRLLDQIIQQDLVYVYDELPAFTQLNGLRPGKWVKRKKDED